MKVRYIGDEIREVSILPDGFLRRVEPDEVFEVPDEVADSYASQPHLYEVSETSADRPTRSARAAREEG